MFQIMCNGKPLAIVNEDGSLGLFMVRTQIEAENACRRLDGLLGQIRWRQVADLVERTPFNHETAQIDNEAFRLPSEGKTLYNAPSYRKMEGFE